MFSGDMKVEFTENEIKVMQTALDQWGLAAQVGHTGGRLRRFLRINILLREQRVPASWDWAILIPVGPTPIQGQKTDPVCLHK